MEGRTPLQTAADGTTEKARAAGAADGRWRAVGTSFLLGALLDLPFGLAILAAPEAVAPLLGVPLPAGEARVYLDLNGLFLLALGAIYLALWRMPRPLAPVAAIGAGLRLGGAALFTTSVALGRAAPFFLVVAALEALLGLAHAGLLVRAARAEAVR